MPLQLTTSRRDAPSTASLLNRLAARHPDRRTAAERFRCLPTQTHSGTKFSSSSRRKILPERDRNEAYRFAPSTGRNCRTWCRARESQQCVGFSASRRITKGAFWRVPEGLRLEVPSYPSSHLKGSQQGLGPHKKQGLSPSLDLITTLSFD